MLNCLNYLEGQEGQLPNAEPFGGTITHHRMPPNTVTARVAEADASRRPSCENATELTGRVLPSSVCCSVPVSVSQIRTVASPEADASRRPSCENAIELTERETVVSLEADAGRCRLFSIKVDIYVM